MGHVSHSMHSVIECPNIASTWWRSFVVRWRHVHMLLQTYAAYNGIWHSTADAVVYRRGERGMEGVEERSWGCKKTPRRPRKSVSMLSGNKNVGLGYTTGITFVFKYLPSRKAPFTNPDLHHAPGYCLLINSLTTTLRLYCTSTRFEL